jgi:hypothetical protein
VESLPGWFEAVIHEFVLLHHTSAHGICHASWRSPFRSPGDHDTDLGMVTDAGVDAAKPGNQRPIFSGRKRRHPADIPKHGCGDGDAGAGVFAVAWPGVRRIRKDDGCDLIKQAPIRYLARIIFMQMFGYQQGFEGVDHRLTTDGICALCDGSQVGFDPIIRRFRVGIGGENDSPADQRRSVIHGERPGDTGAGGGTFQLAFDDVQLVRPWG